MPRKTRSNPSTSSTTSGDPAPARGTKRRSTNDDRNTQSASEKRAKTSDSASGEPVASGENERPRLTTPDLEFDYDRSQLRDARPTPGRVRRPRLEDSELTEEFKKRFIIPQATRPKGRLDASKKNQLYKEQALIDPTDVYHDMYVCLKKGPRGAPTYDSAGFQLDYKKVKGTMEIPTSRSVRNMEKTLEREEREERIIFGSFFVPDDKPNDDDAGLTSVMDYVKDHISKDLEVPWHQIDAKRAREWQQKGFEKKRFSEWWREPNEEESRRMSKMESGANFRKTL